VISGLELCACTGCCAADPRRLALRSRRVLRVPERPCAICRGRCETRSGICRRCSRGRQ
jgi:hypothetical protein